MLQRKLLCRAREKLPWLGVDPMIDRYRKQIATTVVQLAMEDPGLVKAVIVRLRKLGEIEADDLAYLERIADRWIGIAKQARSGARR